MCQTAGQELFIQRHSSTLKRNPKIALERNNQAGFSTTKQGKQRLYSTPMTLGLENAPSHVERAAVQLVGDTEGKCLTG